MPVLSDRTFSSVVVIDTLVVLTSKGVGSVGSCTYSA